MPGSLRMCRSPSERQNGTTDDSGSQDICSSPASVALRKSTAQCHSGPEVKARTRKLQRQCSYFPGRVRGGVDNRHWGVSVSRRAYLLKVTAAAEDILAERAEHRRSGKPHPFDECDLTRLGTHSFKKTGVSLLRDVAAASQWYLQFLARRGTC